MGSPWWAHTSQTLGVQEKRIFAYLHQIVQMSSCHWNFFLKSFTLGSLRCGGPCLRFSSERSSAVGTVSNSSGDTRPARNGETKKETKHLQPKKPPGIRVPGEMVWWYVKSSFLCFCRTLNRYYELNQFDLPHQIIQIAIDSGNEGMDLSMTTTQPAGPPAISTKR